MPDCLADIELKIRAFMRESLEGGTTANSFEELALELFAAQREANQAYAKLCAGRGVGEVIAWREIPCVPAVAFKEMEMTSLPDNERQRVFYSSGTTLRERSRHFHSEKSLAVYEKSVWLWFERNFRELMSGVKWLFLTPTASAAPNSSLAHMFGTIASQQKGGDVEFLGTTDADGSWSLNIPQLVERLRQDGDVAVLGTAFQFVHLLDELEKQEERVALSKKSWIMETGGYKGRSREIPKEELRRLLSERLGVGAERIYGEYGMSELSSQAYEGGDGVFRFPPWARVTVVSPATGRAVGEGERGLIRVHDLANIWSVMAAQTEDFGIKMKDGFQLAGRAAQAEARGCSLMSV